MVISLSISSSTINFDMRLWLLRTSLYCIAAGNVWFDHRDINQARCYSLPFLKKIYQQESSSSQISSSSPFTLSSPNLFKVPEEIRNQFLPFSFSSLLSLLGKKYSSYNPNQNSFFDWDFFWGSSLKICIRMSERAFKTKRTKKSA